MCWTECPCGWITEMISWKEGCTVSQRQTRECHIAKQMSQSKFVELPLALEVLTNSKIRIWTYVQLSLKVQVISQQAKEMSQLQPPPGVWTSKYHFQQVIRVSTDGNCVQGWGEGQQLQRAWHKGWNCRNYSRRTSHHRWLVREVDFRESISASIFIAPLCRQTKLID